MTDKPAAHLPMMRPGEWCADFVNGALAAAQPAPAHEVRPILLDPGDRAPVVGVARVLSGPAPRSPDPRVRTR